MIGLDTNMLIRYITQDDDEQSGKAVNFLEQKCTIEDPGYINLIVLCEMVWVLKRAYGYEKRIIIDVLEKLIQTGQLVVEKSELVWEAIEAYKTGLADFSDYLIAISNKSAGCQYTTTFDHRAGAFNLFRKLPHFPNDK